MEGGAGGVNSPMFTLTLIKSALNSICKLYWRVWQAVEGNGEISTPPDDNSAYAPGRLR